MKIPFGNISARQHWNIDANQQITMNYSLLGTYRIYLNGTELVKQRMNKTKTIPFALPDNRKAELSVNMGNGLSPDWELKVEGQVILSNLDLKNLSCLRCGSKAKADDKFCEKCGAELPSPETQRKMIKMRGARRAIAWTAGMFVFFGIIMFFIQSGVTASSLKNLATFQDADIYPQPINGKTYTVGQLRVEVEREPWMILATNLILGAVMIGLYLYSKRSPLVALIAALGVYCSVIVFNAMIDPKTIGQGIVVKILIIGILTSGIGSALQLRKVRA
jgi:hypothetical protein